jgi:uncharacterized protein YehS (DUF1456 family)
LRLKDSEALECFALGGMALSREGLLAYLRKEGEDGYVECGDIPLDGFLSGLITLKRGPRPEGAGAEAPFKPPLTNNGILKKLRVALSFKDEDILAALKAGGMDISASELNALFRKEGHKNYKPCGDQLLRNFLKGLERAPRR